MVQLTTLLALASAATAFPQMWEADKAAKAFEVKSSPLLAERLSKRQGATGFDAKAQYVNNQGNHKFIAPGPNDLRGPCPGLNAMANHNYLPRNGIASIEQFIQGTYDVFGMGGDLSSFLAVYGAVMDGNLTHWSIGGPSSLRHPGEIQPVGISGSHNNYEGDASPTRPDLYQFGNAYKTLITEFTALYNLGQTLGKGNYDLNVLIAHRANRFKASVAGNPYFFNAPFAGVIASPAAYSFIYRLMNNHSAAQPDGFLNGNVLKSFYAVSGTSGKFTVKQGWERIPDNWYKRQVGDEYTIPLLELDTLQMALAHPEFASIGGNTGKVNTFTGINPLDLTGGLLNGAALLQGNNLACYAIRASLQQAPFYLAQIYTDTTAALEKLSGALNSVISTLVCPQLGQINDAQFNSQFQKYPGFTKMKVPKGSY